MNLYKIQRFDGFIFLLFFLICGYNVCICKVLTNSYLVEFTHDVDRELAKQIAARNGFTSMGPVSTFF